MDRLVYTAATGIKHIMDQQATTSHNLANVTTTGFRAQIDAFDKALDQYRLDTGRYPTTEEGLAALVQRPPSEPRWAGPYLKKAVPQDPWGRPYGYRAPGEHGEYDLYSYGRDGQPGGTAESADVTSW